MTDDHQWLHEVWTAHQTFTQLLGEVTEQHGADGIQQSRDLQLRAFNLARSVPRLLALLDEQSEAEARAGEHLHFVAGGDVGHLECFAEQPAAARGALVALIDSGDSWNDIAEQVRAHRCTIHQGE